MVEFISNFFNSPFIKNNLTYIIIGFGVIVAILMFVFLRKGPVDCKLVNDCGNCCNKKHKGKGEEKKLECYEKKCIDIGPGRMMGKDFKPSKIDEGCPKFAPKFNSLDCEDPTCDSKKRPCLSFPKIEKSDKCPDSHPYFKVPITGEIKCYKNIDCAHLEDSKCDSVKIYGEKNSYCPKDKPYLFDGECYENEVITQLTEGVVSRPYEKSERCDNSEGKGYLAPNILLPFNDQQACIKQECAEELVKLNITPKSGTAKNKEKLSEKCRNSQNNLVFFRPKLEKNRICPKETPYYDRGVCVEFDDCVIDNNFESDRCKNEKNEVIKVIKDKERCEGTIFKTKNGEYCFINKLGGPESELKCLDDPNSKCEAKY